ncbi:hypothetical protein GIB67_003326, partial [Kingdonia uniflora]
PSLSTRFLILCIGSHKSKIGNGCCSHKRSEFVVIRYESKLGMHHFLFQFPIYLMVVKAPLSVGNQS